LREGDRQVPEGIYPIESLNPNSSYHLSLRVGYPNAFDRAQAANEGRKNLGGDIMIHGKSVSIGCLAMGDEAAEDLFVLAADTGLQNIKVVLSPMDFRTGAAVPKTAKLPDWTEGLYNQIRSEMAALPIRP
jgi:murein L,D-transpeptidase YafK